MMASREIGEQYHLFRNCFGRLTLCQLPWCLFQARIEGMGSSIRTGYTTLQSHPRSISSIIKRQSDLVSGSIRETALERPRNVHEVYLQLELEMKTRTMLCDDDCDP